ncbi:MAG TPA: transglycosylase SLT domain-containing protein, partial [Thermoanaerobaculia bacterium]|nr:transglycosylase SLT domain-containing protein [Thermoanaerobaculia bacterium]
RRLEALEAEALEAAGDRDGAERVRLRILSDARRDDAAAIVLARELRGLTPEALADRPLSLLTDTARAQRDLELAEKLATERVKRAEKSGDAVERLAARFDRARLLTSRGRFVEAKDVFAAILDSTPRALKKPAKPKDDSPGTPAFLGRVRFNLGAVLEKLGELDAAERELKKVETAHIGPWGLAALQRARLNLRRSRLDAAEAILLRPSLAKESGRIEGLLLLVVRRCEAKDPAGARRALLPIDAAARVRRLPEPWRTELPFWHGRIHESAGDTRHALEAYAEVLAAHPYSAAAEIAEARLRALDPKALASYLRERRSEGERLVHRGDVVKAKERLLPAALLGDAPSRDLLRLSYERLSEYAAVLLAPEIPDETLATLCGDAGACRLLQLGLPEEAEPIVRDARRLDTLTGCVLAARLAEGADAGPAALEAAEALDRKVPDDFLLELAPRTIRRALAPRPFDRLVRDAAEENAVPRDLLYAVMRQESRFDHEAASPAAARGLMQLTLPAAGEAARERNESPPAYLDLYDPSRSLLLGARTLAGLLARFGGAEGPVVAAYNAGAGQTSLWLGGSSSPAEALLASISYPETRTYFRRVLANRLLYRLAASEGEAPGDGATGNAVRR